MQLADKIPFTNKHKITLYVPQGRRDMPARRPCTRGRVPVRRVSAQWEVKHGSRGWNPSAPIPGTGNMHAFHDGHGVPMVHHF